MCSSEAQLYYDTKTVMGLNKQNYDLEKHFVLPQHFRITIDFITKSIQFIQGDFDGSGCDPILQLHWFVKAIPWWTT